jgi:collagen type III alpha
MDANKDGFLTAEEAGERGARMFERLKADADKNTDGKISREEFDATMAQRRRPGGEGQPGARPEGRPGMQFTPAAMLERMDANKDGKISKEEAPERMREGFDRLDTNGDGFVDADELKTLAERFQQRRPQGQDAPRRRPNPETN